MPSEVTDEWVEGPPTEPGYYWCYHEDQGGWPFIVLRRIVLGRVPSYGPPYDRPRVLCVVNDEGDVVRELCTFKLYKHIKIKEPNV